MIKHLRIRNLALIRDLFLDLSPGLTVVTGETGAGKSLLVDSLALLLGERIAQDMIRFGEDSASVEAAFDLERHPELAPWLRDKGWDPGEGPLILKREFLPGGRSRAFVGERTATLADLRRLGESLVDLHGQHEHQSLLRIPEHLAILDRYAGHDELVDRMGRAREDLEEARRRLQFLHRDAEAIARRLDVLQYQAEEIRRAAVQEGELERLREERHRLRNRERIADLSRSGVEVLHEAEVSALGMVETALAAARELSRFDPQLAPALSRAEEAKLALQELAEAMRRADRGEEDHPRRLEEIEARMALLEGLLRKYGPEEGAVLEFERRCREEIESFAADGNSAERLEESVRRHAETCARLAAELSQRRRAAARNLQAAVARELGELALEGSALSVEFLQEEDPDSPVMQGGVPLACGGGGWDRVQFLLSANPGEPPRPLSRVASGGEVSRIMLAIHLVLKTGDESTVRVFDEVDAGVGGRVAQAVGRKLRDLGRGGQVLCVTHLPQVASLADRHLKVSKRTKGGRTEVRVESLDREGAVREVARMLGGERISDLSLRHAAEMVARGR